MEADEGVEDEQVRAELRDGLVEARGVGLEVEAHRRRGDHLAVEARQAAAAERARAFFSELGEQMADGDLDEASNAVVDLVHAGKFDEAEAAARDLLVHFPEVYDGYDRPGMVAEARGDEKLAAAHNRKVIEFTQHHPGLTDPALITNYHRMIDELDPPTGT